MLMTNAVAIMDLACESDAAQVEVIGAAGTLRKLTRSLVGPPAVGVIEGHFADQVLFSVRGITAGGHLTDPDPLESEVKRAMVRRARRAVLLVDGSKFGRAALTQIGTVDDVAIVLAADAPDAALEPIERAGVDVRRV
jgi:DeoR/GlpR family transcriptional regulator of sugar metabolism